MIDDRPHSFITSFVIALSHFFTRGWKFYIPSTIALIGGALWAWKKEEVKGWVQRKLLTIPLVKSLIIETAIARFSRTLGTLLQGGVPLTQGLKIAKKVMRHRILERIIEQAEEKIVEGSSLSKELKKSLFIPSLVPRLILVGEESGKMQEMLLKIAEIYEEEVEKKISRLLAIFQPVILLFLGAIVGMIMIGVLLPLTDIQSFTGE